MPSLLFVHLTWTTLDRRPLIGAEERQFLKRFLPVQAEKHRATLIAMGAVQDHLHLVLRLHPDLSIPKLVQSLKGASSRLSKREREGGVGVSWARGYDVRTISPRNLEAAIRYVRRQSGRHTERAISR